MLSPDVAAVVPVSTTMEASSKARKLLREVFGHDAFREPQAEVIAHIIAHQDALVLMPTGGGKSLCYQLPALLFTWRSGGCFPTDCPHERSGHPLS